MRRFALPLVLTLLATTVSAADKPVRRYIKNANPATQGLPFSEAVLAGNTLYISGHIGLDPNTGQAPADIDQEIKLLLDAFQGVLKDAGMGWDDLVQVTVFCPDLKLYDKFNAAYRAKFTGDFPARAFIGSGPLLRGGHFEMTGIAVKR